MEKQGELAQFFLNALKHKRYIGTTLDLHLHEMAMLHAPKMGVEIMDKVIALSAAAFVANIGIDPSYLRQVCKISPRPTTLKQLLVELAVESVMLTSEEIKDKKLGLICDKGEDKSTGASFVKLLTYFCWLERRVKVTCFGIEHTGITSKDAVQAINHSLKLFAVLYGVILIITSSTTNAGGLTEINRVLASADFFHPTCALNTMNLLLSFP